jgi:hypothetical protein
MSGKHTGENDMIYRARTGTKVQLAKNIPWASEFQAELYADRIAKIGDGVRVVEMARDNWAAVQVGDDCVVVPKFALDRAA